MHGVMGRLGPEKLRPGLLCAAPCSAEVNGNYNLWSCPRCRIKIWSASRSSQESAGRCSRCNGPLRPTVRSSGADGLPAEVQQRIRQQLAAADTCIMLGATFDCVFAHRQLTELIAARCIPPGRAADAAGLQSSSRGGGQAAAALCLAGPHATPFDSVAALRLRQGCDAVLAGLLAALGLQPQPPRDLLLALMQGALLGRSTCGQLAFNEDGCGGYRCGDGSDDD